MKKLVSIIVPVYNVEQYLKECLNSLIKQSYTDIEIILVDDGSTDQSVDICRKYCLDDNRIVFIEGEHVGVSAARNRALSIAKGEYIAFVDSDDITEKTLVEQMVAHMGGDIDLVYSSAMRILSDGRIVPFYEMAVPEGVYGATEMLEPILAGQYQNKKSNMSATLWRGLFKADIIKNNNITFDTKIRYSEDWLFLAQFMVYSKCVYIFNEKLYYYRQTPNSLMQTYRLPTKEGIEAGMYILKKFESIIREVNNEQREALYIYINQRYVESAYRYYMAVVDRRSGLSNTQKNRVLNEYWSNSKVTERIDRKYKPYHLHKRIKFMLVINQCTYLLKYYVMAYEALRGIYCKLTQRQS